MSKSGFEEDKFFDKYTKTKKKDEAGVPGITMNAPLVPRAKTGDIGLELELEATNALPRDAHIDGVVGKKSRAMWNAKHDGSLRGNAMEYVVSTPVFVDELPHMVNGLFEAFTKAKTKLDNSNRCSTHVHINIGGYTIDQLTAIIALWTTFEEALINWCGEARLNNHYSLSSRNSVTMLETWEMFLRRGQTRFPEGLKYSALNLNTIWNFGSVEFRCGPAADNAEIPIKWASFLYYLSKYAVENYKNLYNLPRDLSELGGLQLFKNICDSSKTDEFFNEVTKSYSPGEFNDLCLTGFRNAQNIVLGFPWDRWSEEINKEYVPQPFAKKKQAQGGLGNPVADWANNIVFDAQEVDAAVPDEGPRRQYTVNDIPRAAHRNVARNHANQILERRERERGPLEAWEREHIIAEEIHRFVHANRGALGIPARPIRPIRPIRLNPIGEAAAVPDDNF